MPYIKQELREEIDKALTQFGTNLGDINSLDMGCLNYIITKLLLSTKPQCYSDYNNLIGLLECCKLEFYRRAVVSYEETKRKENGDVY